MRSNAWLRNVSFLTEEEISEMVFRKLLDKKNFTLLLLDTNLLYSFIFDNDFNKSLPENTIIVPSTKFSKFIVSRLLNSKPTAIIREPSTVFKLIRSISDYHYRILIIERNEKIVLKFKKNIKSSLRDSSLNIIGIYNIFGYKNRSEKMETMRKILPDLTIVGTSIVKFVKFLKKDSDTYGDKKLLKESSIIFSSRGVKGIAGVGGILQVLVDLRNFLKSIPIFLWLLKEEIARLLRGL
ncbi:MAG: hypothetical protein N2712_00165 [Brevinematales bacterium]|nr:hypothetical protein [Brevinematales bacterium]